ncbi:MBL fold metallo-hydrolase [Apibacter sp. HY039]|uniref:MBL fold metallo-hydrolase n=1 Tax=Apibacter sp. HY039 TaxID=2501476 RepID=UPI000FEBD07A|nr:3',5'-cyclic-nucleotide phosphodiesterase [Apibacter sp. HY039]
MKYIIFTLTLLFSLLCHSQTFDLIPLGIYGGLDEDNLSAYIISEKDKNEFLCMDAGTIRTGIKKAIEKQSLAGSPDSLLKNNIKGYFISHGHLDHVSGMIINSPDDSPKNIYALSPVIEILKKYYFTEGPWINFANEGNFPQLNKYYYRSFNAFDTFAIDNTQLTGQIFELSHGTPYKSSALLVKSENQYILYLGDTGADRIEKSTQLKLLWKTIAPLINQGSLKAILIEVSFPNSQPENLLFGHLTPALLYEELTHLSSYCKSGKLKNLPVIITHLKPSGTAIETIKKELITHNVLEVSLIFPEQGKKISL